MAIAAKSFRYLTGLLPALGAASSFLREGLGAWQGVLVVFLVFPILDQLFGRWKDVSVSDDEQSHAFDWILYLSAPLYFALFIWFLKDIGSHLDDPITLWGRVVSMGLLCGVYGINVAHELGHRRERFPRLLARLLLSSSLYSHFYIEHNRGHHKHVATTKDPSSARLNEPVYFFWFRSMSMTWITAWKIEKERLKKLGLPAIHYKNEMIQLQLFQWSIYLLIYFVFGYPVILYSMLAAFIGAALLETINYIEHYGLQRKQLENGNFERVQAWHSWNSDHLAGRFILFELSRHSDHHFKASKHFPSLESLEDSPQMPLGYPGMMVLSLVPPLFFAVMNPRIKKIEEVHYPGQTT